MPAWTIGWNSISSPGGWDELVLGLKSIQKILAFAARHETLREHPDSYFDGLRGKHALIDQLRLHHPGILKKCNEVRNECHKLKGYIRLIPITDTLLLGTYRSRHVIMDLIGRHFSRRLSTHSIITWNESLRAGCFSPSKHDLEPVARNQAQDDHPRSIDRAKGDMAGTFEWMRAYPMDPTCFRRMRLARSSTRLMLVGARDNATFYEEILPRLAATCATGCQTVHGKVTMDKNDAKFKELWNAFYSSQDVGTRKNYRYALQMIGKKYLLEHFGRNSIEARTVLGDTSSRQKSLLDFKDR
ncbi:DUF4130 domain-containing protein [Candidatus Bathyarchaeota archaeon]|nr:DUF4130 domain-containing protein [Candidatus Bathyarchaeota archaeon]